MSEVSLLTEPTPERALYRRPLKVTAERKTSFQRRPGKLVCWLSMGSGASGLSYCDHKSICILC